MKRYSPYIIGTVLGVLLAIVVSVRQATALGPPCFTDTNGHLFETFICWMFDNGLTVGYGDGTFGPDDNITRGQMAVFLQRMRSLGDSQFNSGTTKWAKNGASANPYVTYYTNVSYLRSTVAGSYGFQMSPDVPSSLYNSLMYVKGLKLCYDATPGGVVLDQVWLEHFLQGGGTWATAIDNTNRTDNTCRFYYMSSPTSFYAGEYVAVYLQVIFSAPADYVGIRSATIIMSPSASPAVLEPDDALLRPALGEPAGGLDEGSAPE
jgi:hypothetical protein